MPAMSQSQRGYLGVHFGPEWMKHHHFDNKGKLPAHVRDSKVTKNAKKNHKRKKG